jgi:hypothetical protein
MHRLPLVPILAALLAGPGCQKKKPVPATPPNVAPSTRAETPRRPLPEATPTPSEAELGEATRTPAEEAAAAVAAVREAQPVAGREPAAEIVTGQVTTVDADGIVVERPGLPPLRLQVEAAVPVAVGGQPADLDSLTPGMDIRVEVRDERGVTVVKKIDATVAQ